jgi:DNA-binding response OmpR family regulator
MSMQYTSKLLIIEDDPFGRDALDMVLEGNGFELHFAANGHEGLQKAAELVPDLILLDVMMPGMDGYEVCRRIRSHELLAEVPVLMITALDDRTSRLEGINAGADDYINKPLDPVELLARVRGITRLSRYRHLLNERHRFEWLLDQATDGYFLLDNNDRVLYANPTAKRYFELGPTANDEDTFLQIARRHYQCEPASAWEAWTKRPHTSDQPLYLIRAQQDSSPAMWLQVAVLDQLSEGRSQRLVRLQDVSASMGTEQAMWAFQSMVRHKLNTPVHGIAGCIELLNTQPAAELDPQELSELLQWTTISLQRLQSSVDAVLRYAAAPEALEQGETIKLEKLPPLLKQVGETLTLTGVEVVYETDLRGELPLSHSALELVFSELLENAKKFHPQLSPQVTVAIQNTVMSNGSNGVRIRVMDDGVTLSPSQLEKIWLPYYQGERTFTGEVPGMGLGLSLVRSLMWRIGGSCAASNRIDEAGVVVELCLPLQFRSGQTERQAGAALEAPYSLQAAPTQPTQAPA